MAFGYRKGSIALFCSKGEDAGQEQPETQSASALFGMYSGWRVFGDGQRGKEKGILDREESAARTMNGARILVRGEIKKAEQKEDTLTLILEQVTAEAGRRTAKFRRIVVYVDNGAKGKSDSGFREALTAGLKVQVRGKLAPVEGPGNPGEFDFRTYYRTKGTACRLYGENLEVAGEKRFHIIRE